MLVVACLALAACSTGGAAGDRDRAAAGRSAADFDRRALAPFLEQELAWETCGTTLECADLEVPVDYAAPSGETLRVALARQSATDPEARLGSLVMNPGGPGGSGVAYVRSARFVTTERLRAGYDLIGIDPRGVQKSTPAIDCLTDAQLDDLVGADASPDDDAELAEVVAASRAFGAGCAERSPDLYAHVGTADAALDLEVLRSVLGEERLNFLGKSYGTLLGITYAETFPDRVGRFVLDGVLDPALEAEELLGAQAAGFERAYRSFLADCVTRPTCPFDDAEAGYDRTVAWLDELDDEPLVEDGSGRELTQPLAQLAVVAGLYDDQQRWSTLRTALRSALDGSPAALLSLADAGVDRRDGRYLTNANEAQYAVTCLDRSYAATVAETARRAERFAAEHPIFGSYLAWGDLACSTWPAAATRTAHEVSAELPPMLLIGTTADPATPLEWSQSLADQLGNASLLTWEADGHTAYSRGSACVDEAVDDFLVGDELPTADLTCRGR